MTALLCIPDWCACVRYVWKGEVGGGERGRGAPYRPTHWMRSFAASVNRRRRLRGNVLRKGNTEAFVKLLFVLG